MSVIEDVHQKSGFRKYVAAVLFGAIILVFVFLGTDSNQQMGPGFAARVNDQVISIREFRTSLEQMVQFYAQMFGGEFDAEAQKRMRVRSAALEQLISRSAMIQEAGSSGFTVTAAEVRDIIIAIPAFQQDGRFKREFYDNFLANRRFSAAQFEDDLKRDIMFGKVRETFQSGVLPAAIEVEKIQEISKQKVNIEFVKINAMSLEKRSTATASEANAFLATDDGLKEAQSFFESNKSNYAKEEQVHARHILIGMDTSKPGSESEALAKVKKAQELLKTKSFDSVAKDMSDDPGSKSKGGDLGFFSQGRMVKEFEDAAFSQEIGIIGEPVKTKYGYHIIRVEAKNPKTEASFDVAKMEIAQSLVSRQKKDRTTDEIRAILSGGSMTEVNKLISNYGLKWEETGLFSVVDGAVPKLGDIDEVYTATTQISKTAPLYKKLITHNNEQIIIRLKAKTIEAETIAPDSIRQKIVGARVRDAFSKWNESIVKVAKIERNAAVLEGEIE